MTEAPGAVVAHLVFACDDLPSGVERIADLVGVEPAIGGRHPQWGTRNALLALGRGAYLEVVGPDPDLPIPPGGRGLGVDGAGSGRLVTWCARTASLADAVGRVDACGVALGSPEPGSRVTPSGDLLEWVLTDPGRSRLDGVVPFLIDWGSSPHPSGALTRMGRMAGDVVEVRLRHPQAELVRAIVRGLGGPPGESHTPIRITEGDPAVEAVLRTPRGERVLR